MKCSDMSIANWFLATRRREMPFSKPLVVILKKMCKFVGADYKKMDFHKDDWYWDYTWTKEEEGKFADWMVKYLMENKKARKMFSGVIRTKNQIKEATNMFIFNYGWKVSEDLREN